MSLLAAGCLGDGDGQGSRWLGAGEEGVAPEMAGEVKSYVVRLGRAALEAYFEQGREAALSVELPGAPAAMSDSGPQLYVTLRTNGVLRASYSGDGNSFLDIVRSGVVRSIEDERFGGVLLEEEVERTVLEYNAVFEGTVLDERTVEGLALRIEPGRHAFSFTNGDHGAFFKETVMITHNYTHEVAFGQLCAKAELPEDCYTDASTRIERHRAEHWVESSSEPEGYYELFRAHRMIRPSDVNRTSLSAALELNGDYLRAHQTPEGDFDYLYQPDADALIDEENTVRQAGACYAVSKLASMTGRDDHLAMAHLALENVLSYERENESGSYILWSRASLGISALALLGLSELRHPSVGDHYKEAALRLSRGIAGQQLPSGRIVGDFDNPEYDSDDAQQFYPGEALLALVRTLSHWPGEDWILPVLERSFEYYRDFWREQGNAAFVPWQAAAWGNAYLLTGEERYADFAFELMDWSIGRQNFESYGSWEKDDYGGALDEFTLEPPNFSSATHSEPLPIAIHAARLLGDTERAERYAEAERHAMRFVLQLLITDRETFYMPSPERSLGGVRTALDDNDVRIDNVQHAATAFVHALEYLPEDDAPWYMADEPGRWQGGLALWKGARP